MVAYLQDLDGVTRVVIAGSLRRRKATVGDIDIVVVATEGAAILKQLTNFEEVREIVSQGDTRATVILAMNLQVDVREVPAASLGAALYNFTGARAHSIAVRRMAQERGLKLNEYGLYRNSTCIAGETEEAIFEASGMAWVPPELREGNGEIEAAREGRLPNLVTLDDLRGDLHSGAAVTVDRASVEAMAAAAQARGYAYLAITDDSHSASAANELDPKRVRRQLDTIDRLNESFKGFRLLTTIEAGIREDGLLELSDSVLKQFDLVLGILRTHLDLSFEKQTRRVLRALDHPWLAGLAQPTARRIGECEPVHFDFEKICKAAAERSIFLEVNAQPARLDLDDAHCRMAKELGVMRAISSNAHGPAEFAQIRFGVDQARRGWVEAKDVLNTRPLRDLLKLLRKA